MTLNQTLTALILFLLSFVVIDAVMPERQDPVIAYAQINDTPVMEAREEQRVTIQEAIEEVVHSIPTPEPKQASQEQVQGYINKYFPTTPITAQMIIDESNRSGVPVSFILAVGHNESHMGTKGRAVPTRNPFNVGNVTAGDNKPTNCRQYSNCLGSWEEGLQAFTSLITRCYFHEGEEVKLETWMSRDFRAVRCNVAGKRYMTDGKALGKYQERLRNLQEFNLIQ